MARSSKRAGVRTGRDIGKLALGGGLALALGCGRGGPTPPPPNDEPEASQSARSTSPATSTATAMSTASATPSATASSGTSSEVRVAAAEVARVRGVALGVRFPQPGGWRGGTLEGDHLAFSSSPPGGSDGVSVDLYRGADHTVGTLRAVVTAGAPDQPIVAEETQTLAGAARPAVVTQSGSGPAAAATCTVLVQDPGGGDFGLTVALTADWRNGGTPTCAAIAGRRDLAIIVAGFEVLTAP